MLGWQSGNEISGVSSSYIDPIGVDAKIIHCSLVAFEKSDNTDDYFIEIGEK